MANQDASKNLETCLGSLQNLYLSAGKLDTSKSWGSFVDQLVGYSVALIYFQNETYQELRDEIGRMIDVAKTRANNALMRELKVSNHG